MGFLDNYDLRQFNNLELLAKQVVEGFIIGLHKSPFHGFSVEFAEHRVWNPGETTKNIDWKVYARTDRLYTKKYEEETNLRCQLVIDTSSSMYFPKNIPGKTINKLQFSSLAAASIMNLLSKQRDAYGLSIFDEQLLYHTRCKSSQTHYRLLLSYIENLINDDILNKSTSTASCLHEIAERVHRRSLVIIFSDMLNHEDNEAIFSALQHLKYNKHEVVLFHVTDRALEMDFEFEDRPYEFIDMETGEKVRLQSNAIKEHFIPKAKQLEEDLLQKCLQYKIDFVPADINEGFHPILEKYLVKRKKMIT
jgi:uncharacterized protein (DUF58 family)